MTTMDVERIDTAPTTARPDHDDIDLDAVIRTVRPAFQPIVELGSCDVVGFEALARWPHLDGITPDRAFAAARRAGAVAQLDQACRRAAARAFAEARVGDGVALFVNAEPVALADVIADIGAAPTGTTNDGHGAYMVMELTERALANDPAALLRAAAVARASGWAIALDDVGAEPASLALLPFLDPDVIKLDIALVRARPTAEQAAIMAAVLDHAEQTGAKVLAEGIESAAHLDQALALGATHGQGYLFGRPGAPFRPATRSRLGWVGPSMEPVDATPFSAVASRPTRVGRKGLLLDLTRHIERHGASMTTTPVLMSAFQDADRFTPATARRYARLAERSPLVAALGRGLAAEPAVAVRGAHLADDDQLCGEWTVTAVGPHYAGALIARDLGDGGPDADRRFEFVITHDRQLVLRAARSLMSRLIPLGPPSDRVDAAEESPRG